MEIQEGSCTYGWNDAERISEEEISDEEGRNLMLFPLARLRNPEDVANRTGRCVFPGDGVDVRVLAMWLHT